jgi:hypothetical protein
MFPSATPAVAPHPLATFRSELHSCTRGREVEGRSIDKAPAMLIRGLRRALGRYPSLSMRGRGVDRCRFTTHHRGTFHCNHRSSRCDSRFRGQQIAPPGLVADFLRAFLDGTIDCPGWKGESGGGGGGCTTSRPSEGLRF